VAEVAALVARLPAIGRGSRPPNRVRSEPPQRNIDQSGETCQRSQESPRRRMGRRHRRHLKHQPRLTQNVCRRICPRRQGAEPPGDRRRESRPFRPGRVDSAGALLLANKVSVEILSLKEDSASCWRSRKARPGRRALRVARSGQIFGGFFPAEALRLIGEKALGAAGPRCRDPRLALVVAA